MDLFGTIVFQISDSFLSQLFVILLIIFRWFWRIHLSRNCDESVFWVGIKSKKGKRKKTTRDKNSKRISIPLSKRNRLGAKKRRFDIRKRVTIQTRLPLPSLTFCIDMEQFVLVPASVYDKTLNTQAVKQLQLPKCQAEQNPKYQNDLLKREINKKWFAKADSLFDKILSFHRIKLSNSQTLVLDGAKTGVSMPDFAQQLRRKNADVPDIYLTLLDFNDITPTRVFNQTANVKDRSSCFHFKI